MKMKKVIFGATMLGILAVSCGDDDSPIVDPGTGTPDVKLVDVNLSITGLDALGADFVYEGWLIVDGKPVSTGRFTDPATKKQEVSEIILKGATAYVLSIEPANETGQDLIDPAATKLFKADFDGDTAGIAYGTINAGFADLVATKEAISGEFFLRTPTDEKAGTDNNGNDEAGVWFGTPGTMPPASSLELPVLAADSGWKYEGWAVVNGKPYSTGTFSDPKTADDNAAALTFRGIENQGPPLPGEDFINNLDATGFKGGADLRGATVVISLEPFPDNDPKPFTLKPLVGNAGDETAPATYAFGENLKSFPTGTITR